MHYIVSQILSRDTLRALSGFSSLILSLASLLDAKISMLPSQRAYKHRAITGVLKCYTKLNQRELTRCLSETKFGRYQMAKLTSLATYWGTDLGRLCQNWPASDPSVCKENEII